MAKRLKLGDALSILEKAYGRPRTSERPEEPLLDHLLVGVLSAWVDRDRAGRAARAISESFLDVNEARVSPISELVSVLAPYLGTHAETAAIAARTALQDVFDGTHGLDLEPLRGRDPDDLRKFLKDLPHTMGGPAAAVPQLALGEEHLALSPGEQRVLARLGLLPRASTAQRVRQALERVVKPSERLAFAWALGSHAGAVCHVRQPACEACMLLPNCPFGAQEMKQRAVERKRLEVKRAIEEKKRREQEQRLARIAARAAAADAKKKAAADAKAARAAAAAKKLADAAAKKVAAKAAEKQAKKDAVKKAKDAAKKAKSSKKKPSRR